MAYYHFRNARAIDGDTLGLYNNDLTKLIQLDDATANYITAKGGLATTKGLVLKSNVTDTYPAITLLGNDVMRLATATAQSVCFDENGTIYFKINEQGNVTLESQGNRDIELYTGTGVVKFGAYTAKAAETYQGYITIKDSGGTSRKLAVYS